MKMLFIFLFTLPASLSAATKLALNWKAEPQFGGFYQAEEKGHLEILQGGSGTPTLQMLLSGKVDYAIVSADEIIIAHDRKNTNLVAIFAVYQKNPQAIMTRASNPVKGLNELLNSEGTLLWQEGLPYAQYLKLKNPKMKILTAPYLGGIGNFLADEKISQQCFATSEPLAAEKKGIKTKVFLVADSGYNPYTTVLATTKTYLKKHQDEVRQVVQVVREGWDQYLKNPQPTNQKMQKLNPSMDLKTFEESSLAQKPLIETSLIGSMEKDRWQLLVDQLFAIKSIKTKPKTSELFVEM